jgi:hypothetical protein
MSALLTPRRPRRRADRPAAHQDSLFSAAAPPVPQAPTPAPETPAPAPAAARPVPESTAPTPAATPPAPETPAPAPVAPPEAAAPAGEPAITVRAHRQGPTLDDLVAGVWEGLLAGAPADCPACGAVMSPRHSAGAGIVGGRCGGCGSSLG